MSFVTQARIKKCKAGTLLTNKQRFIFNMSPNPFCGLCVSAGRGKQVGDVAHTLGGCPEGRMRELSFHRHDTAVNIIAEAIQDGYKGAVKVLWDSGADETRQKDEDRQTLPRWLFKDPQVVSRKRPDIVMLPRGLDELEMISVRYSG